MSGLLSGVRIVTLSAVCVMVNSNGLACPAIGFCGRHVPDRFGGVCARPLITTNAARTSVNTARFISSSLQCNRTLRQVGEDGVVDDADGGVLAHLDRVEPLVADCWGTRNCLGTSVCGPWRH